MEVKDFFFNVIKSLSLSITVILENFDLKQKLFKIIYSFIDYEYSHLFMNARE